MLGRYLRWALPDELQSADFQGIPLWRDLTVQTALAMVRRFSRPLIVPMTLVVPKYFDEIIGGLERAGVPVLHFTLRAEKGTILARVRGRPESTDWTTEQVDRCVAALRESNIPPRSLKPRAEMRRQWVESSSSESFLNDLYRLFFGRSLPRGGNPPAAGVRVPLLNKPGPRDPVHPGSAPPHAQRLART